MRKIYIFMKVFLVLFVLIFAHSSTFAYETVSGDVSGQTWTSGSTYYVSAAASVANSSVLQIEPGTVVKFAPGIQLTVLGTLLAAGNLSNHIVFTSRNDNSVGETIAGSNGNPNRGDWSSLYFQGNSTNQGTANMEFCDVRYGGSNVGGQASMLYFYYCTVGEITNSTIEYSSQNGMRFLSSSGVFVDNNTIANNNGSGILNNSSDVNFSNCEINNNALWAINLDNVSVLDYPGNSGSGNGYDAFSLTGTVTQDLTMSSSISGFPYVITGFLTVNDAVSLTFPPGEVIKLNAGNITVNGSLYSQGTESEPIVFTSFTDDEFGGDLNKDDTQTVPAPGNWRTLTINGAYANDGFAFIDHTVFRYGGANYSGETSTVYFTSCDQGEITNSTIEYSSQNGMRFLSSSGVLVDNNTIANNNGSGILNNSSDVNFSNCEINNNALWAINLDNVSVLDYPGNSGSGNGYDAFSLTGTVTQDLTMSSSISGFPYVITGFLTVNDAVSLTFPPGEVIKLNAGNITVNGSLYSQGTESEPIVFTSFTDDEFGGDLNKDDTQTVPAPGNWRTLTINGAYANDGFAFIDHTVFRYGGANYSGETSTVYFTSCDQGEITNSTIEYSSQSGMRFLSSSGVLVDNNTIANNNGSGILNNSSDINFSNCEINNNALWAINLDNVSVLDYPGNSGSGNGYDAFSLTGTVTQDLTMSSSISGFPYVITGFLTVNDAVSLTFPPGEVIKLDAGNITVNGSLYSQGTESEPIVFTSFTDDEFGGDLNKDDTQTVPAPGNWRTLTINGAYANDGFAFIDHTVFRYGGANYSGETSTVYFTSCDQGEITNSTIEYSSQNGMRFLSSSGVLVDNNTIANNNGSGILNNSSDINFSNCEINNNALWAINLDNVSVLDYPGNSGSGNGYDAFSLTGTVTQDLTMSSSISGFPYVITGFLTVNDAVSLTFPPGEVIKLNAGNITVNGSLYSQGTESEPIVFTSFTDDEFGGDLNKDGTQSSPARGNWRTLTINGAYANDGFAFIDHTIFRYGGANYSGETSMLYFTSCDQGEITNSTVEYSSQNGMRFLSSSGINFENNEASNNNGAGIMNNTSTIDFTACQIKNNSSHGISLNGGESMISACQISNNGQWAVYASGSVIKENNGNSGYGNFYNVFGISGSINDDMELSESLNGFPYAVIGVLTINPGSIVTIPAGEVIKSSNGIITVNGTLNANGHLKNPVVFTSFKDDEYGGDWNHDGIVGIPAPGDWHGITVNGNAGNDGIGQFDNCLFRYGGKNYSNDYANLYFDAEHPESFVKYCSFEYSLKYGLRANNSQILVRSSYFSDNVSYGIYVTGSTLPDLGQNSQTNGGFNHFVNNNAGNHQLYYSGITNLPAYYNDWGFYTAPEIDEHIFDNEESGQAGQVLFDPWFDPEDPTFFLNPDYSVDFEKIHVGGYVHFTDESTGFPTPNRWEWDFETDGDVESEAKNPYHAYGSEGLKTVCLVVSNGAYSKVLIKEDYINVGNYGAPDITAIKDVPNDQGGWVYVNFNKSEFDTSTLVTSTEYYTVQLNDGNSWFSAGYSSAYGSPTYSVVVHTPFDSTQYDPGIVNFRVIGSMDEGNYSSYEVEGYSVDNIRPTAPSGLLAGLSENTIYLNWVGIPDEDFHYFGIYRSESPDNFPAEPYTTIAGPEFNDEVGTNDFYYYKITAFDYTGNESDASNVVETYKYHDMIVEPGWTGVSTYFNPADGDLNSLFAPVMSNLILMQNQFGLFWPDQNINTLGDWNYKDGYVVKASTLSELVNIKCTRQDNKTVWLSEGWNLIPVLSPNNVNVSELFLEADIKIVKEVAGWRVFWPEFNINTLQSVNTGKAYFVYANADQSINYPILPKSGNYSGEQLEALVNITPWNDVHETPASHTIAFGQKVLSLLKAGDFIAAFDADDRCVGLLEVNGQNTALAIFGDDITTTEKDGYDAGEQICMKLYRPVGGDIFELELSYNPEMNTGNYEDYGLSQVVGLKMAATGISDLAGKNIQIYPNPSKGIFNIEGISTASSLAIFNTFGEEILSNDLIREGTIDLGHQPNGVYFVRIATSKGSFVKKLIKE